MARRVSPRLFDNSNPVNCSISLGLVKGFNGKKMAYLRLTKPMTLNRYLTNRKVLSAVTVFNKISCVIDHVTSHVIVSWKSKDSTSSRRFRDTSSHKNAFPLLRLNRTILNLIFNSSLFRNILLSQDIILVSGILQ